MIQGGGGASVSRDELAQQLFKTDDLPRLGWAQPRRPWLPGSQQRSRARDACRRLLEAITDLRCERHLESAISRSRERQQRSPLRLRFRLTQGCWFQHASSRRSPSRPCRRSLAVPQEVNQSTKSDRSPKHYRQLRVFHTNFPMHSLNLRRVTPHDPECRLPPLMK